MHRQLFVAMSGRTWMAHWARAALCGRLRFAMTHGRLRTAIGLLKRTRIDKLSPKCCKCPERDVWNSARLDSSLFALNPIGGIPKYGCYFQVKIINIKHSLLSSFSDSVADLARSQTGWSWNPKVDTLFTVCTHSAVKLDLNCVLRGRAKLLGNEQQNVKFNFNFILPFLCDQKTLNILPTLSHIFVENFDFFFPKFSPKAVKK